MKMTGWEWDHAKAVADRNAERFASHAELERYLIKIGWEADKVEQMMKYLAQKRAN